MCLSAVTWYLLGLLTNGALRARELPRLLLLHLDAAFVSVVDQVVLENIP